MSPSQLQVFRPRICRRVVVGAVADLEAHLDSKKDASLLPRSKSDLITVDALDALYTLLPKVLAIAAIRLS